MKDISNSDFIKVIRSKANTEITRNVKGITTEDFLTFGRFVIGMVVSLFIFSLVAPFVTYYVVSISYNLGITPNFVSIWNQAWQYLRPIPTLIANTPLIHPSLSFIFSHSIQIVKWFIAYVGASIYTKGDHLFGFAALHGLVRDILYYIPDTLKPVVRFVLAPSKEVIKDNVVRMKQVNGTRDNIDALYKDNVNGADNSLPNNMEKRILRTGWKDILDPRTLVWRTREISVDNDLKDKIQADLDKLRGGTTVEVSSISKQ